MKKEQLFESIGGIDEEILARSEKMVQKKSDFWKILIAAAACFGVIMAAVFVFPNWFSDETEKIAEDSIINDTQQCLEKKEESHGTQLAWNIYYNETETIMDSSRKNIPGYFTEELSNLELKAVQPERTEEWMQYSGYGGFDGEGELINVYLDVTTTIPDCSVSVILSGNPINQCGELMEKPISSLCGEVEYQVYQCNISSKCILLEAESKIHDTYLRFTMETASENVDKAKADFKTVLECFAEFQKEESAPNISIVTAEYIPEWFDQKLTLEEARKEADFGSYMIQEIPAGFTEESIRRYKNQNMNYLSGLWTKGYDSLSWKIYFYDEKDEVRLTSVEEKKNYDLSLYPIPRAESVPENLREIVDNPIFEADELTLETVYARAYQVNEVGEDDGWRMEFCVRYEDVIVEVRTKGIEPTWVYEQLMNLQR